jgi:hypothetical protein
MVVKMEYSQAEIQAVESAQLIANVLPALDKPLNGAIPAKVKAVAALDMSQPDAYWTQLEQYERHCGGRNKAMRARILKQLMFQYQLKPDGTPKLKTLRYGSYWWAHTKDQWAIECHMTYDEARRAIEGLERDGIIETRDMKSRASHGIKTLHVRWMGAGGSAALSGYPAFPTSHKASKPDENHSHEASKPDDHKASKPDVCIKGFDLEGKELKAVGGKSPTLPGNSQALTAEMQTSKSKAKKPDLKAFEVWKKNVQQYFPENYIEPKATDLKNLGPKMRRLYKSGVTDYLAVLEWVTSAEGFDSVRYEWNGIWDGDVNKLENPPMWPDLPFLLNERNLAVTVAIYRHLHKPVPTPEHEAQEHAAYLAEQAKFSSAQQIMLNAMAPKEMKFSLPLHEQNPELVAAMFAHADFWQEHQIDGLLGGRTLKQYLAGFQWITPAMMEWIGNEAVREHVEELLGVRDTAAA